MRDPRGRPLRADPFPTRRSTELCGIEPVANIREQLQWYILMHATGPVISAVHAGTRRSLEEVQTIFADFEQPRIGCHRANVHDVRPNIQHMITDELGRASGRERVCQYV